MELTPPPRTSHLYIFLFILPPIWRDIFALNNSILRYILASEPINTNQSFSGFRCSKTAMTCESQFSISALLSSISALIICKASSIPRENLKSGIEIWTRLDLKFKIRTRPDFNSGHVRISIFQLQNFKSGRVQISIPDFRFSRA